MKIKIILVSLLFLSCCVFAQEKTKQKKSAEFQSIVNIGIFSRDAKFLMQSINGVRSNKFFVGAGLGLDFYYQRTIPVTIELRQVIFNWESSPFIYVAGGLNFPWPGKEKIDLTAAIMEAGASSTFSKGGYYDMGVGYNFPVSKNMSVALSLGYSIKQLTEHKTVSSFYPFPVYPMGTSDKTEKYNYDFRRLVLKAGLSF